MQPNPDLAGRVYQAGDPYLVGREKLREFATAVGATHPAHHHVATAQALGYVDIVAPPTFAAVIAQRAEAAYVTDQASGIDFSRVVHAAQAFTHYRPIVAGDLLSTELTVGPITTRSGLGLVTTVVDIIDDAGAPVAQVTSQLAVRGEGP